jgi:hypothetical protein
MQTKVLERTTCKENRMALSNIKGGLVMMQSEIKPDNRAIRTLQVITVSLRNHKSTNNFLTPLQNYPVVVTSSCGNRLVTCNTIVFLSGWLHLFHRIIDAR